MFEQPRSVHPVATIDALLDLGMQSSIRDWRRILSPPAVDAVPLRFGTRSLAAFGLSDTWPEAAQARGASFVFTLHGARVHSTSGIVVTENGEAIRETMHLSRPERDGYAAMSEARIALPPASGRLNGTWLSLLLGGPADLYRVLMLNVARVALLSPAQRSGLDGVLLPAGLGPLTRDAAEMVLHLAFGPQGAPERLQVRLVGPGEGLDVETLLLPWNIGCEDWINALAVDLLRPLSLPGAPVPGEGRRIFIDRRQQTDHPLLNEDEVVSALERLQIEPVRIDTLDLRQLVGLFSQSELIVGAHAPGLAGLVFAAPGAALFEIRPHRLQSWRYRSLCAAAGVSYDCVLGRSVTEAAASDPAERASVVSVAHLTEAISEHLGREDAAPA